MSVYELLKNDLEKIVFDLSEFKGKDYIDIRLWIRDGPLIKEWRPTAKGLSIPLEQASEFMEGVGLIFHAIEKKKEAPVNNRKRTGK
ncbi:hypothetical protein ES705_15349 [subsurface metagenome]